MTTMTKAPSRYHVLSLSGTTLSIHRTVEAAAREIQKHNAWTEWSLVREDRHIVTGKWGGRKVMISEEERREARAIRFPALTEYDAEPPA